MHENLPREESQIYEDISTFLQAFKKAIAACELMYMKGQRGADNTNILTNFCDIIEQIKALAQNYTKQAVVNLQGMTFSRFTYRLLEIITCWKLKYKTKNKEDETPFQIFLKQIEAYVRECQKKKSFVSLVSCTQILLLKFANRIINSSQGATVQNERMSQMGKKLREQLGRLRDIGKLAIQRQYQSQKQLQAEESEALLEKKEKFILTNRIFLDIQQRFDKFRGMDVDFSYFRGSYFQAKNNYDGFYQNYRQRNSLISTSIGYFESSFSEYKKRRELKELNRKKSGKSQRINQTNFQKKTARYTEGDQGDKMTQRFNQTLVIPFNMTFDKFSGKLKSIYGNSRKCGKNKEHNQVSLSIRAKSNQLKIKLDETCYQNSNNSLLLDQSLYGPNKRFNTSPSKRQKQINIENNENTNKKTKNRKITKYDISPKIQIKTKCFQIGKTLSTTSKQLKFKVFPINKFSIRQPITNWIIQK